MADTGSPPSKCHTCSKPSSEAGVSLRRCAKCLNTNYCSRECQVADWKTHKKTCTSASSASPSRGSSGAANNAVPGPTKGLSKKIEKPFHRLSSKTWLHDRPEQDVFTLLIDVYRMHVEDDYVFGGNADDDSVYGGCEDGRVGFRKFLKKLEKKPSLLPSWWNQEKADECLRFGLTGGNNWASLASAMEKSDVIKHYGDPDMPMQLRMFAEEVYGIHPAGQSGAMMMAAKMAMEK